MSQLRTKIAELRGKVAEVAQQQRQRTESSTTVTLAQFQLHPEIQQFYTQLITAVKQDIYRYSDVPQATPATPTETETEEAPSQPPTPIPLEEVAPLEPNHVMPPIPTAAPPALSRYMDYTLETLSPLLENPLLQSPKFEGYEPPEPSFNPAEAYFFNLATQHIAHMEEHHLLFPAAIDKMRKALHAFCQRRYSDAFTLFKNAQKADPHNHSVAFIFSQFRYFQANNGHADYLPEARDDAKKSTIYSDKIDPDFLLMYRYHAVAAERTFSVERPLELLRECNLLEPEHFMNRTGLTSHNGIYLKAWLLLSTIPTKYWQDFEFESLYTLATRTIGGACLYFSLFRGLVLEEMAVRKNGIPIITTLEQKLETSFQHYHSLIHPFEKQWPYVGNLPWTVMARYLNTVRKAGPIPTFDQILLNVSLNGRQYVNGAYPDDLLINAGLVDLSYWRIWAVGMAPDQGDRMALILPAHVASFETQIFPLLEETLTLLREEELERIEQNVWGMIQAYLPRWSVEHLLAAGTGSNQPRGMFAPTISPFSSLYRKWGSPIPSGALASEIIHENAQKGAFANPQEALAAFEGAFRMLDDPNHGLKAQQKKATKVLQKENPKLMDGLPLPKLALNDEALSGSKVVFNLLIPIAIIAFLGVSMTMSQSTGRTVILALVLITVLAFMAVRLTDRDNDD